MPNTSPYRELHDRVAARSGAADRLAGLRLDTLAEIGLYELRRSLERSQTDLAAELGISQPAVSQLATLRGRESVNPAQLPRQPRRTTPDPRNLRRRRSRNRHPDPHRSQRLALTTGEVFPGSVESNQDFLPRATRLILGVGSWP